MAQRPQTLYEKIWAAHVVERRPDGTCLIYIDRHLVHEVTSPQAFEGLRVAGRKVRRPELTLAVPDHNLPTTPRKDANGNLLPIADPESAQQLDALRRNTAEFGVDYIDATAAAQGIVHVVGPEQGFTLPGTTLVCGDSHTSAHGALGALAFGIGTSEVEHVLATQTLLLSPSKTMEVRVDGTLGYGVSAKDVVLAIIGKIGAAGGTGHVIEFTGSVIRNLSVEGRLTIANMSIEGGARAALDRHVGNGQAAFDRQVADHAAGKLDDMTGAARRADLADDRQHHVLGRHAIPQRTVDAHFHRLGRRKQQRLGRQHMLDLRRADAEGQRPQRAMRRGMAVAADERRARQGEALFRPHDMDDALRRRGRVDIVYAKLGCVAAKRVELLRAFRVGDRQQIAVRVLARRGRQVVIGDGERQLGPPHLAPGHA